MPAVARQGDIGVGVCPLHNGPQGYNTVLGVGAVTVFTNGKSQANIGTPGIASCGHPTIATTGSGSVTAETKGVHRVGDSGQNPGPYTVTTGSPNVTAGD